MTGQEMVPEDVENELIFGTASGKAHAPEQLGKHIRQLEGIILEAGLARSVSNAKVGNAKDKPRPKQVIGRAVLNQNVASVQIPCVTPRSFISLKRLSIVPNH